MIIATLVFYHYFKKPISLKHLGWIILLFTFIVFSMGALRAVAHKKTQDISVFYSFEKVIDSVLINRNFLDVTKTTHIAQTFPYREPLQYGIAFQ